MTSYAALGLMMRRGCASVLNTYSSKGIVLESENSRYCRKTSATDHETNMLNEISCIAARPTTYEVFQRFCEEK